MSPVKVLIVDDSPIVRTVLKRILDSDPDITVEGTAINGQEAMFILENHTIDLILTDLNMPIMDGHTLVKKVMQTSPKPIIVISSYVSQSGDDENAFKLLEAGALEVLPKPEGIIAGAKSLESKNLLDKIKTLSQVVVLPKQNGFIRKKDKEEIKPFVGLNNTSIVIVGSSTGGPQTLQKVFETIQSPFPLPIVIAQHISRGFLANMVEWLGKNLAVEVLIAKDQERPLAGNIYFAPDDAHLTINGRGLFETVKPEDSDLHTPSVDVLFNSVTDYYNDRALGILLTGMGKDGAAGLLNMKNKGCFTVAQDEASSVIYGMPKAAAEIGAASKVLSLDSIISFLDKLKK